MVQSKDNNKIFEDNNTYLLTSCHIQLGQQDNNTLNNNKNDFTNLQYTIKEYRLQQM